MVVQVVTARAACTRREAPAFGHDGVSTARIQEPRATRPGPSVTIQGGDD